MTTKDEALKLALEALENGMKFVWTDPEREAGFKAITAIKQALAAPVQEPVAMTFDEAWASLSWQEWRMKSPQAVFKELHRLTTPPSAPVQEPIGEVVQIDFGDAEDGPHAWVALYNEVSLGAVLYTTPPAAQPALKPLTPAQVHDIWVENHTPQEVVSAVEAAHGIKEKNT